MRDGKREEGGFGGADSGGQDGDDGRSVFTVVPHELESVEEEDEERRK